MPDLAGLEVEGVSIGGIETCIEVPGYRLAFDAGRCPHTAIQRPTILFTHAHLDHMGGVAAHAGTRALLGQKPPTYLIPHENVEAFDALFAAWRDLDGSDLPHVRIPIGPGEEHALSKSLVAVPFRAPHRAPAQGYVLYGMRHKLRDELAELPPQEIARLKREGREVTHAVRVPELAFSGDSRLAGVLREDGARKARRLVLEVTFLDDRVSVEASRAVGHVHLDEVCERADEFENEAILFTHFSARYRADEIVRILDARLPQSLRDRVQPLLTGFR
ncbi:MAG: hypothetical protein GY711_34435 [bacterium]|nr:hypothetical protein [bacterium]